MTDEQAKLIAGAVSSAGLAVTAGLFAMTVVVFCALVLG